MINNTGKTWLWFVIIAVTILGVGAFMAINSSKGDLLIDDFEGEISAKTVDYGTGAGAIISDVSAAKDIKYHGEQSLKFVYEEVPDGYMWLARGYNLDVKGAAVWLADPKNINWKRYYAFSFYLYGTNSGASIALDLIDSGFEYQRTMIKDDFIGWKQIVCPLDKFMPRGDWQPEKADANGKIDFPINAFQFEPRSVGKGTLHIDYVQLLEKK